MKRFFNKLLPKLRKQSLSEALLVVLAASFLSLLFLWPALPEVSTMYIGDGWDNYEYASYQQLAAQNVADFGKPFLHSTFWRYPVGFDFTRGFDSYISVGLGALLLPLLGIPLAYNATIFIIMAFNGVASYIFGKTLTGLSSLGYIAMIMYGFSFYALAKATSHPNMLLVAPFMLFAAAVVKLIKTQNPRIRDYSLLFFTATLTILASAQYGLLLLLLGIVFLGFTAAFYPKYLKGYFENAKGHYMHIAAPFILFLFFGFFIYGPHLDATFSGDMRLADRAKTIFATTPSPLDFVTLNPYLSSLSDLVPGNSESSIEKVVFLGWVELVLFLTFFFLPYPKRLKFFVGGLFALFFLLALGYGKQNTLPFMPYAFLGNKMPLQLIAEPGRFFVLFSLFMTTAVLLTLRKISNPARRAEIVLLVAALLILERFPYKTHLSPTFVDESYVTAVQESSSTAVLDIPVDVYHPRYNALSFLYGKPIVSGYFHWSADGQSAQQFLAESIVINRYSCSLIDPVVISHLDPEYEREKDLSLLAALKYHGITTIVVHTDDKFLYEECRNVRMRLEGLTPFLHKVHEDEKAIVYSVK